MLRAFFCKPVAPLLVLIAVMAGLGCAQPDSPNAAELALGTKAPDFELRGVDGELHALPATEEVRAVAVIFTSLGCPVARAYESRIIAVAREYEERGVRLVAIVSNDSKVSPPDSFDKMKARFAEMKYPFLFLSDETQSVAKAFGATVTPHVFVFGPDRKLVYRGRVDDSMDEAKVTQSDLRSALDATLAGKKPAVSSTKAFGCTIKWTPKKSI